MPHPHIRGSRDTRDNEFNNQGFRVVGPGCPGCWEDAPEHTYPQSYKGTDWWCSQCIQEKVRSAR